MYQWHYLYAHCQYNNALYIWLLCVGKSCRNKPLKEEQKKTQKNQKQEQEQELITYSALWSKV